jgi:hypothetical protein
MFSKLWHTITGHRKSKPDQSYRLASAELGIPKSTIHHHDQRLAKRNKEVESVFWNSEPGQNFLKRLIVSAIYTFGIKGGIGAGRIEEFMQQIKVSSHAGVSRSSIYRLTLEIEASILRYKELQEQKLTETAATQLEHLEVVLGLDETWLDRMLLVCQELSSGYLFLSSQARKEALKIGMLPSNPPSKDSD